jgi:chemotaxis protein methyltransferase CheR
VSEAFALSDATFGLLRDLIAERTGIFFDEAKRDLLADKLAELITRNGLTSFLDYYYWLRYDDATDVHLTELMDRLSVPETYFWRQPEQILALSQAVVPMHFAAHPDRPFRVWSAACCTGEEPLSIAIALDQAGLLGRYPITITGSDGSPAMVERARRGEYASRSFRQLPNELKEKYFEPAGDRWRPIERIRRAVQWSTVNLVRPAEVRPHAAAEAIFCRNAFIYFSDDAIRIVVRSFAERMPSDAYLFLGSSESLTRLGVDLELAEVAGAFVYVKEGRRLLVERARASAPTATSARAATP